VSSPTFAHILQARLVKFLTGADGLQVALKMNKKKELLQKEGQKEP